MNCDSVLRTIPLYYYGELTPDEEERFEEHVDGCAACRTEMERHQAMLKSLETRCVEPPPELLDQCRQDLMRSVYRHEAPARLVERHAAWPQIRQGFEALLAPFVRLRMPLAASALIALGFVSARLTIQSPANMLSAGLAGTGEPVAATVRSVQPDQSGRVRLVLDETRRRTVFGSLDDSGIQSLLLAAARDGSNPSVRVESVAVLKSRCASADVRDALLNAVATDANAGVRLKALEGLKPYGGEPEVRNTLARVLLKDENPSVRIQAIDMLIEHRDDSMVGVLQSVVEKENNSYVRMRCERALREMNASVGTF